MASGYEEDFVNPVDEDFHCLICHLPLKEPVQTKCGHRFCKSCLERHMQRQQSHGQSCSCPLDRENLVKNKDIFPDKAMGRKILSLVIKCPSEYCHWTGELRDKEEHMGKCAKLPVECPDGCGAMIAKIKIPDHTSQDCPLTAISCPYSEMGCNKKVQRIQLESHLASDARLHLAIACVKLHRTQEEFKETTRKLEEKVDALQKKLEEKVDVSVDSLQKKLEKMHERVDTLQQKLKEKVDEKVDERVNTLQKKLEEKVGVVRADLTSRIGRIEMANISLEHKLEREFKESTEEMKESPFIWKINGFHRILNEATSSTEIESAPFFTEENGYKVKLKMQPRGDLSNSGKTGYVSLYLVIMRGKYDAILPWPFKRTVTFTLIDQQEDEDYRENIVIKFYYEDSPASQRPTTEENFGRGVPKFICHDKIRRRRYIVDDTVFFEVEISS